MLGLPVIGQARFNPSQPSQEQHMRVNQLAKGTRVRLRNGWEAEMVSVRGNTPVAKVFGDYTETGSVYAHDIVAALIPARFEDADTLTVAGGTLQCDKWVQIEHTPAQVKLRKLVASMGL
jgi:hypothetical protein